MKSITVTTLVVTLMAIAVPIGAEEESPNLLPACDLGDLEIKVYGFSQYRFQDSSGNDCVSEGKLSALRLRTDLKLRRWGLNSEIDFADMDEEGGNWLRYIHLNYDINEDWQVRVGRLFLAAGYATPAPFMLETVNYPKADPFACYAWGVQVAGKFGDGWSLLADVTGRSGVAFDDPRCWDRLEFSGRLQKKYEAWTTGGTIQLSEDFFRFGLDTTWKPNEKFYLRAGGYYGKNNDSRVSNHFGAYALAVYRPTKWFEFHSQVDHQRDLAKTYIERELEFVQRDISTTSIWGTPTTLPTFWPEVTETEMETSDAKSTVWTNGIRLFCGKGDRISLTFDYELPIGSEAPDQEGTFWARGQIRF